MGFQILDKEGVPVPINELDKQAAEFWGKEVHPKHYADPSEPRREGESEVDYYRRQMCSNWFDKIGNAIEFQGNYTSGWNNLVLYMIDPGYLFIDTKNKEKVTLKQFDIDVDKLNKEGVVDLKIDDGLALSIWAIIENNKPFIALINHWQSKGYTPKKVNE